MKNLFLKSIVVIAILLFGFYCGFISAVKTAKYEGKNDDGSYSISYMVGEYETIHNYE